MSSIISEIEIIEKNLTDLFALKNNKSLLQTLQHLKYKSLLPQYAGISKDHLSMPLGSYLQMLKEKGDLSYKQFLNPYGDEAYCRFRFTERTVESKKGLYQYLLGDKVVYVGRCNDSYKKRFGNGYGCISPKNCYRDGQRTNCKINSLVNIHWENIKIVFIPMENRLAINEAEKEMLKALKPEWNDR